MIDIEELKKLPTKEKVHLIDELMHSLDDSEEEEAENDTELSDEVLKELEHRIEDMQTGKMETYTWEEAKIILRDASFNRG